MSYDPFFAPRCQASPERPALVWWEGGARHLLTWAGLDEYAQRVALWLWERGARSGDVLGAYLENSLFSVGLILATVRLGVRLVVFHRRLSPAELEWQVRTARPRWLIRDDRPGTGKLAGSRWIGWDGMLPQPAALPEADTAASFTFFTSGTSGYPKAVTLSLANLKAAASASSQRLNTRPGERWLLCLPLYHIGGLSILFRAAWDGMTVVFQPRFEAAETARLVREEAVNLISLVPTMLYRLMPWWEQGEAGAVLRLILLGGSATDPSLLQRALEAHLPVALTYGLTEAASQVCTALPELVYRKPGSVGKPLPGVEVEVRNAQGERCAPGEIGEIWVRGPAVASGYEGQPPFPDGVLQTGDLGYLDEEGDLWVLARRSDLILSGGENVYPAEVERVLMEYPGVQEVCAFGLPDAEWGQQVAAAVVAGGEVTAEALIHHARQFLAGYKVPRRIVFVPELPRTPSGKVKRHVLAEWVKEGRIP